MKDDNRMTTKISRATHAEVKDLHPQWIGATRKAVPFYQFLDTVLKRGLTSVRRAIGKRGDK